MSASFIYELSQAVDVEVCEAIVGRFEADPRKQVGETAAGATLDRKVSQDLEISEFQDWSQECHLLQRSLQGALQQYAALHEGFGALEHFYCPGLRIHKYAANGFFDWHIDSYNKSVSARVLSCIWYLNTVYEGGETMFKAQGVAVRPECGKLLLFPTTFEYVHRGAPPVGQNKYVVVGFVEHGR